MQLGKFAFQRYHGMAVTRNVARAAGPGRSGICCVAHGADHVRVLAHAEIVIGTPDDHFMHAAITVMQRHRMASGNPLQLNKMPVAILGFQPIQSRIEMRIIVAVKRHGLARFFSGMVLNWHLESHYRRSRVKGK